MGTTPSRQIGHWVADSLPVFETDLPKIENKLLTQRYVEVDESSAPPAGYAPKLVLYPQNDSGSRRIIYGKISPTSEWFRANKELIRQKLIAAGISASEAAAFVASDVVPAVLPLLTKMGKAAALKAIDRKAPGASKVASVAFDVIEEGLRQSLEERARGEPAAPKIGSAEGILSVHRGAYEGVRCACMDGKRTGAADGDGGSASDDATELRLKVVKDYVDSSREKAKQRIINDILKMMRDKDIKPQGATPEEQINNLWQRLKNVQSGSMSDKDGALFCFEIAQLVNKYYGSDIINLKLDAVSMCRQLQEFFNSLRAGSTSEFIAIYKDTTRVIENLNALINYLEMSEREIAERIASGVISDHVRTTTLQLLNKQILDEARRQLQMLNNLLGTTLTPTMKNIMEVSKEYDKSLIEPVAWTKGEKSNIARKFTDVLYNIGITGFLTNAINAALRRVGMTMKEYQTASLSQLRERILQEITKKELSDEDTREILSASELLYRNFHQRDDIRDYSEKYGSAEYDERGYKLTRMESDLRRRRKIRTLIFNLFVKQLNGEFDKFVEALNNLSREVGITLPISDQLMEFRRALRPLNEKLVRNPHIFYALIGYYNDQLSVSKKEELVKSIQYLRETLRRLMDDSQNAKAKTLLVGVDEPLGRILSLISRFTEDLAAKYGSDEINVDPEHERVGGNEEEEFLGLSTPVVRFRANKTIEQALRKFEHQVVRAQIVKNLASTGRELREYKKDYPVEVGQSIATILEKLKVGWERTRELILKEEPRFGEPNAYSEAELAREREAALKFLTKQYEVRRNFWLTVEAIDNYLRVFTEDIVDSTQRQEKLEELSSILDSISVISEWYNENTGEQLAAIFDHFPNYIEYVAGGGNPATETVHYPTKLLEDLSSHYYSRLGGVYDDTKHIKEILPGNPYLVADASRGVAAAEAAAKMMSTMGALKNFVSIFNSINVNADKDTKTYMPAAKIHQNLVDYICMSAFCQGFNSGVGDVDKTKFESLGDNDRREIDVNTNRVDQLSSVDRPYGDNGEVAMAGATTLTLTNAKEPVSAALFRKRWGVWMRSINKELQKYEGISLAKEDAYFILILKAMAAKILMVLGMHRIFEQPLEENRFAPERILLGAFDEFPVIESDALELYWRLPLLAQFYRNLFAFDIEENNENKFERYEEWPNRADKRVLKISLVPDLDGTFSGIIRLIFRKHKHRSLSEYSDSDLKELVEEINRIYIRGRSAHRENVVRGVLEDFMTEINRRFGVVTRNDRDLYLQSLAEQFDYSAPLVGDSRFNPVDRYDEMPVGEVHILPHEEELGDFEGSIVSPAQQIATQSLPEVVETRNQKTISLDHKKLLYRFRAAIDKFFKDAKEDLSFADVLNATKNKLATTDKAEERFKILAGLLRGSTVSSKADNFKYLLFHETVVSGLNALSAIHSLLSRFKERTIMIDIDALENEIWDALLQAPAAGVHYSEFVELVAKRFLIEKMHLAEERDVARLTAYLSRVFGNFEDHVANGGESRSSTDKDNVSIDRLRRTDGMPSNVSRFGATGHGQFMVKKITDAAAHANFVNYKPNEHYIVRPGWTRATDDPLLPAYPAQGVSGGAGSLVSVLFGHSIEQLRAAYKAEKTPQNEKAKYAAETFMRFFFGRDFIMQELIELLYGIGNDLQGLVKVTIQNNQISISFGGLQTLIKDMFASIGGFMDLLRPQIDPELYEKYHNKFTPGSYYWLREQFFEKLLNEAPPQNERAEYVSLEGLARRLQKTFMCLTRKWYVDGRGIDPNNNSTISVNESQNKFDKVFARLAFYDASRPSSGIAITKDDPHTNDEGGAAGGLRVVDFMSNPYDALHFNTNNGVRTLDTRYAARFHQLYTWKDELTQNRSLLFGFNQLLAKYIQAFYDPIAAKMYSSLLEGPFGGIFQRAVSDPKNTYPDTAPLWFVKPSAPAVLQISTVDKLKQLKLDLSIDDESLLRDIVTKYFEFGNPSEDVKPDQVLSIELLSRPQTVGYTVFDPALARFVSTDLYMPKLFVIFLQYLVALIVDEVFENLKGKPDTYTIADATREHGANSKEEQGMIMLDAALGLAPNSRNLGGYKAAMEVTATDKRTRFLEILNRLSRREARIPGVAETYLFSRFIILQAQHNRDSFYFMNTNIPSPLGRYLEQTNHKYLGGLRYFSVIASTHLNSSSGQAVFEILPNALKLFPLPNDIILTHDESIKNYAAKLFADILLIYTHIEFAPSGQREGKLKELRKALVSVGQAYVPSTGASIQRKTVVKYDDLYDTVSEKIDADRIFAALPNGYLLLARQEAVDQALPQNNIRELLNANPPGKSGSDQLNAIKNFGRRFDPDADNIVFTSLAIIMRNMFNSRAANSDNRIHIIDNVADVPSYMKEKMRANLPGFRNLFKELEGRCRLLQSILNMSAINVAREFIKAPDMNPWPYTLKEPKQHDSETTKSEFGKLLENIANACNEMVKAIEKTHREISDRATYLEIHQNSIEEYEDQYSKKPFMPLSSTLHLLANQTNKNYMGFFPIHSVGEPEFKFLYGIRGLINNVNSEITPEVVPGWGQILAKYDLTVGENAKSSKDKSAAYLTQYVKLMRYINNLRHVKGFITSYTDVVTQDTVVNNFLKPDSELLLLDGSFVRDDFVVTKFKRGNSTENGAAATSLAATRSSIYASDRAGTRFETPVVITNRSNVSLVCDGLNSKRKELGIKREYAKPAYAVCQEIDKVIQLTESAFEDEKVDEIVAYMCDKPTENYNLEIQNIIDLNVMPINVHALMRDIPLANLYNYAYTFERHLVNMMFGVDDEHAAALIEELNSDNPSGKSIRSTKEMIAAMLIDPYMNVNVGDKKIELTADRAKLYDSYVKGMLLGVGGDATLSRPKFLSDQIYGKVIFGELYSSQALVNESGPQAVAALERNNIDEDVIETVMNLYLQTVFSVFSRGFIVAPAARSLAAAFSKYLRNKPEITPQEIIRALTAYIERNPLGLAPNPSNPNKSLPFIAMLVKIAQLILRSGETDGHLITRNLLQATHYILKYEFVLRRSPDAGNAVTVKFKNFSELNTYATLTGPIPIQEGAVLSIPYSNPDLDKFLSQTFTKWFVEIKDTTVLSRFPPTVFNHIYINTENRLLNSGFRLNPHKPLTYPTTLHWISTDSTQDVKVNAVKLEKISSHLHALGHLRFDTVLVRNLMFIVNLYRSMRSALQKELMKSRDIVSTSLPIVRTQLTEFYGNEIDARLNR